MINCKTLSDKCKWFEKNFSPENMIPELPVIIRIDGNNFHNWTKGLNRPFDQNLTDLMIDLTKALVKETNAIVGFHQSDEITLILYSKNSDSIIYNAGKKQKILSKLTGFTCNYFNSVRPKYLPNHNKIANFDCRIYQVPTLHWACNQLLWRENDATKNSIYMLANSMFSDKVLHKLNGHQIQDKMMLEYNVNWNDLDTKYKRGTYVKRIKTEKQLTQQEIENLPPKHNLITNPDKVITRHVIETIEYPIFNKITNKVDVIFNNAEPILNSTQTELKETNEYINNIYEKN